MGIFRVGVLLSAIIVLSLGMSGCDSGTKGTIPIEKIKKSDFPALARISIVDAMRVAQQKVPGTIIEAELEGKDKHLVYEIEIVTEDRTIRKVIVDAGNGTILKVKKGQDETY